MATTTTFTTMIPTPQPKKPGPPVPPRPQQSSLLKTQQRDVSSSSAATTTTKTSSATTATSQRLMSKVGLEQPQILKKPIIANATNNSNNTTSATANSTSVTTSGGRTVIYKSPSLNLQKRQEERENRNEASTQTATTAITRTTSAASATTAAAAAAAAASKAKLANGTQAPKPPLKLRKAPDVPTNLKPRITAPQPEVKETNRETDAKLNKNNNNANSPDNNIVIVQSAQGVVTLNRHHSMGAASPQNKPSALAKDTRLSLGKADFERVGKIQVQQLQPTSQPLPKPRKIVKVPVATLDVEDTTSNSTNTSSSSTSSNTLHVNLFKRSKTSIENFTSRSNITTVNTNTTGSYLSGKTVEIKNNLKNAAERLFSEIMVNQQKQNALEATNTIITKHERAIQHQAEPMKQNNANNVTVVTTSKDYALNNDNNNCTRINITTTTAAAASGTPSAAAANNQIPNKLSANSHVRQVVSAFNSPEKKSAAFHEMLISELAAMRTRSCSMENLQTTQQQNQQLLPPQSPLSVKESSATIDKEFQNYKQFKTLENQLKVNNNKQQQQQEQDQEKQQRSPPPQQQLQNKHHQHHKLPANDDDIDADNIEDADGDIEEDLKKSLKVITAQNSPRKRTPSGCSSDSSPYGTERSARIRTSDWIEVGDNGKQVTLTSCHISLEDSGLEDEERMDEMSSSGVGDSWDSVKEAEQQHHQQQQQQQIQLQQQQAKRCRNVKRIMSINDLPPLPKSLSGINKMLASDSGLVSDVDTEIKNSKNNELLKHYENQKENNNNLNINNNNNNINSNNNNALKDASDKFNNASVTATTTMTATMATTTTSAATSTTTPLKEINGNETISEIPPAIPGSKLDTQIATLRKEMFGLRQLDLSLLSQLWALNDSIQEFRTMIQEQEQDDDETYSTHSRSPSPYDSVSSDAEDEILTLKSKVNRMELQNGNVITTQPKLTTKAYNADSEMIANQITTTSTTSSISSPSTTTTPTTPLTISALADQQKSQLLKPPVPKPLDVKPVPRMRSAPPPPPTHRKSQTAPPRPT